MIFDMERAYVRWNDDLNNKGVYVGNSLFDLKYCIESDIIQLPKRLVHWNNDKLCFEDDNCNLWVFVYLPPTYHCVLKEGKFVFTTELCGRYDFAEFDDKYAAKAWCDSHDKFAAVAKAWLNGEPIEYKRKGFSTAWRTTTDCEYRVVPNVSNIGKSYNKFTIGKIYRDNKSGIVGMCIAINTSYDNFGHPAVLIGGNRWITNKEFEDFEEVND